MDTTQTRRVRIWLPVVLGFGVAAFLVRWVGLTVPIVGPEVTLDPREVFVTLGAAIGGPVGGVIVGLLADLPTLTLANGLGIFSMIAHAVSGLLLGLLYRLTYNQGSLAVFLLKWSFFVAVYYYLFLVPTFLLMLFMARPEGMFAVFGANLSLLQAYIALGQAAWPEALGTLIVTTIILAALPKKYRRPLW